MLSPPAVMRARLSNPRLTLQWSRVRLDRSSAEILLRLCCCAGHSALASLQSQGS